MIRATAPGKLVLWGEYAVLADAPALVMAVDRYAVCTLAPGNAQWTFAAAGFAGEQIGVSRARLSGGEPPPPDAVWSMFAQAVRQLGVELPLHGRVHLDTAAFYHGDGKLGLGSSSALGVAIYAALCRLRERQPDYATAMAVHRRLQGGAGSGVDVAAAWHGGLLRFRRDGAAVPWSLPDDLRAVYVWSGRAARTTDHLQRFQSWREAGRQDELDDLAAQSCRLFETADPLAALPDYVACLRRLDSAAELGIFSPEHERLARLAIDAGVVYKPCGAGGGDMGAAFTADPQAAARFRQSAAAAGFLPLALETAPHGFQVTG